MKQQRDIQELLDRYWEGETTLEEERWLKEFFAGADIPPQFRREASYFQTLRAEQQVQMPGAKQVAMPARHFGWFGMAAAALVLLLSAAGIWWFTSRQQPVEQPVVLQKPIDNAKKQALQPIPAPHVMPDNMEQKTLANTENRRPKPKRRSVPQVEAKIQTAYNEDTCEDPEQALAEIKAALALVSSKIKKGKQTLDKGLQEVDHVDILLHRKDG